MANESGQNSRRRVHYVWTYDPQKTGLGLMGLAVGLIIAWIVGYTLIGVIGSRLEQIGTLGTISSYLIATIGSPIIFILIWSQLRYRALARQRKTRKSRLERLAGIQESLIRLPHRRVEQIHFHKAISRRSIRHLLFTIPQNSIILANMPDDWGGVRPESNRVPFEPVNPTDLKETSPLIRLNIEENPDISIPELEAKAEKKAATAKEGVGLAIRGLFVLAGSVLSILLILFIILTTKQALGKSFSYSAMVLILPVSTILLAALSPLFFGRRWWLVPGGIAWREHRLWRREVRIGMIRADQSPLIVDMLQGAGFIIDGKKIRRFKCPDHSAWAVVAGWISTARTPTLAEVRTLMGAEQAQ